MQYLEHGMAEEHPFVLITGYSWFRKERGDDSVSFAHNASYHNLLWDMQNF